MVEVSSLHITITCIKGCDSNFEINIFKMLKLATK